MMYRTVTRISAILLLLMVLSARELAGKTLLLLGRDFERFGAVHEYYLPYNREPELNKGFLNWNFLVLNMMAWLEGKPVVFEF